MKKIAILVAATALAGGIAVPASSAAQDVQGNAQAERVINGIIDGLIGNRYRASERDAVRSCGWAAVDKAERDYRRWSTGRPNAYPGYRGFVRVVAISDVQRRDAGFRVRGLLDTARRGYRGGGRGDVEFRCNTDRRGRVQNVRLQQLWR
jgi:hypothetical protein